MQCLSLLPSTIWEIISVYEIMDEENEKVDKEYK